MRVRVWFLVVALFGAIVGAQSQQRAGTATPGPTPFSGRPFPLEAHIDPSYLGIAVTFTNPCPGHSADLWEQLDGGGNRVAATSPARLLAHVDALPGGRQTMAGPLDKVPGTHVYGFAVTLGSCAASATVARAWTVAQ